MENRDNPTPTVPIWLGTGFEDGSRVFYYTGTSSMIPWGENKRVFGLTGEEIMVTQALPSEAYL